MKERTSLLNPKVYYAIVCLIGFVMLMSIANGQLIGTFGQNYDLKRPCINNGTYCSASAVCNITINYPDGTNLITNKLMTNQISFHNYTINNVSVTQIGEYQATMMCQDGGLFGIDTFEFQITGNGKSDAGSGVIVLFTILFIILAGITCYLTIYTIGHLMSLDFDLVDLAFDWGVYFGILALYFLEKFYLGNIGMESYLLWFISIGGVLLILIPVISFILSITIGTLSKKRVQAMNTPQRIKFRRTR